MNDFTKEELKKFKMALIRYVNIIPSINRPDKWIMVEKLVDLLLGLR